jgi:hypothetical protein
VGDPAKFGERDGGRKLKTGIAITSGFIGTSAVSRTRRAALKEGAVGAVGLQSPQEKRSHREKVNELDTLKKKRRRHTVRLFGTNSLKEGAM